jgi:hypothetical protein
MVQIFATLGLAYGTRFNILSKLMQTGKAWHAASFWS